MIGYTLTTALFFTSACRTPTDNPNQTTVVVKANVAGQVQRILISEGVKVNAGTPLIEIAPDTGPIPAGTPAGNLPSVAADNVVKADREVEAARNEVVRQEAEVQRLTPLVASGQASQAELDGAQALYQQAQQRLQRAQDAAASARQGLDLSRSPGATAPPPTPTPQSKNVNVIAPVAGTVTVIGARIGDRVIVDQPLATIRPDR